MDREFRIKLNEEIAKNEAKKLVVNPETGNVEWKGMRGDHAKEKALEELRKKYVPNKVKKNITAYKKIYMPLEIQEKLNKKAVTVRYSNDDINEGLEDLDKILSVAVEYGTKYFNKIIIPQVKGRLILRSNSDCEVCKKAAIQVYDMDELKGDEDNPEETGLISITHINCTCGVDFTISWHDESGKEYSDTELKHAEDEIRKKYLEARNVSFIKKYIIYPRTIKGEF